MAAMMNINLKKLLFLAKAGRLPFKAKNIRLMKIVVNNIGIMLALPTLSNL